jgi:hypothetical protein
MRFLRFRAWLTALQGTAPALGAVFFEEVRRHAGVDAAHAYGGFLATLTAWCEGQGIPYSGAPVGTIKKHDTGRRKHVLPGHVASSRPRWRYGAFRPGSRKTKR